jgi:hypothetical protein
MAIEIVEFPSYKMVDLSIAMLVYQRVFIGIRAFPPETLREIMRNPCKLFR